MNKSLARGIGIGLVAALSGLLLVGFSSVRHSGFGMMGQQSRHYSVADVCAPTAKLTGQTISVSVFDMGMMMGNAQANGACCITVDYYGRQSEYRCHKYGDANPRVGCLAFG